MNTTQHSQLSTQALQEADQAHYLPVFKRYPIILTHGEGSRVWDTEGKSYIDVLAGIAVNSVGHCHPKVVEAIKSQAEKLIHISNLLTSEPQVRLAEKLTQLAGLERVFFSNSGAEAVEAAFKIARKYAHKHGRGGKIISMEGCFHGRTLATTAAGTKKYHQGIEPVPEGFVQVPYNNLEAVKDQVDDQTAAIIVEPVQWADGIRMAHLEFLQGLRQLCDEQNIILIFDEIQCGMARTGKLFAYQKYGVKPDVITLAKALGGGVPIGATLVKQKVADALNLGDHGTTFGGNPLVCAAALATLAVIEEENLAQNAIRLGAQLTDYINNRAKEESAITGADGIGLMIGINLNQPARPVVERVLEKGVIASAVGSNTIRFVPPLNINWEELKKAVDAVFDTLKEMNELVNE